MDEAQRGREEEEGGSGGGWVRDGVPGAGSRGRGASLGAAGDGDGRGLDDCVADAPPVAFWRGGSFLPPLVDCRVPVDGDGSDDGD